MTAPPRSLTEVDLGDLAVGCTILAGGGGGDPRVGLLMALHAVRERGPVSLAQLDDLDPDDLVVSVGMVGAPTVMAEKIPNGDEGSVVRRVIEQRLGTPLKAFLPLEMGGLNGVLPVAWAVNAGLPLIDGDLMGRAFPELQMCTPHLHGISASPAVVVDERSQAVQIEAADNIWLERLARGTVSLLGGCACAGLYPMTAETARLPTITGTISRAVEIGRAIRTSTTHPLLALDQEVGLYPIITGKVIDVTRRTADGFVRGHAVVEGTDHDKGRMVRIEFQNENLVVLEDGQERATVPDIITVLDRHTAHGIVTENLAYGMRVMVAAFASPEPWRTSAGLQVVGPRAFGYDVDYTRVEDTFARIS